MMTDAILEQIKAHALRAFPLEACGLILRDAAGVRVLECDNIAPPKSDFNPGPEGSFLIDPIVQARHIDKIAAVYHSHPNRSAALSAADIAAAERCNLPFLVVSVPEFEVRSYTPRGVLPADYAGRDFVYGVMDCLSLVTDYYRHELGIDLGDPPRLTWGWWEDVQHYHAFVNGFKAAGFERAETPRRHDVVIMQLRGVCPSHAAIYRGDQVILHHAGPSAPSREETFGQYWRSRTVCFMRHRDL